mgnify:CR=1 FL=1
MPLYIRDPLTTPPHASHNVTPNHTTQVDAAGRGGPSAALIGGAAGSGSGASAEDQPLIDRLLPYVPFDWESTADNDAVRRYYSQVGTARVRRCVVYCGSAVVCTAGCVLRQWLVQVRHTGDSRRDP